MSEGDAVKVCVRVRPIIHREQGEQVNLHWKAENATISQVDGTKSFIFDRVFNSLETTSQVYQEVAVPIICSALQGYNGTIFAYGQTSSGKTYTMMGTPNSLGVIPQAVQEVFKIIQEIPSREFLLRVSYMEIYNETVTDLLCDDRKRKPLEIREDINRNVYVADLTEELVMVPEHVMQWIKKGEKNRHYGETKMNDHSSRSHTIFRMIVESRDRNDPGNSENCDGAVMVSHLNLVDLAGSERASQTGAEGVRLKEGCNINRSLFILGQVIKKLSDGQVGGFINYRDSKLTRILQNSLGGNTKTVIICTITLVSVDETLSTLQFASTAKHVRNTPHVNEVLDDQALLKRYRKEIMDLKKQLEDLEASSEIKTQAMAKEEHSQLLTEIKQLQKEREDRIWHLTSIVVASSQEDKRVKLKRRVTWAPGKSQNSLVSPFEVESKMSSIFAKQAKISSLTTLPEIDDSICAVFSDFDDAACTLDDFALDTECNFGSKVTCREKTALCRSMIDFPSDEPFHSRDLKQDSSLQKCNELEQKVAKLESQLKKLSKEYEVEVEKKESLEKETASLKQHVQTQGEKDELVKTLELEIITLKDQLQTKLERNEQGTETRDSGWGTGEEQRHLETNNHIQDIATLNDSAHSTDVDQECANPTDETLSSCVHDICQEQIQMLEQKIADLEGNHEQNDFMESLQICEALMIEKNTILEELATTRNNFDSVVVENESLKRDMAEMKKCLQEKNETNEFEVLEKATQKEYEALLTHEIAKLKTLIENAEVYNQELETELDCKSKLLQEQEKQITELKRDTEALQKRLRYSDLSASMGESDKLYEEVVQLKQSLSDAETVTRDAQREAAFLRSANLELKEKMDELSIRSEQREKDASVCEKQLEIEKLNFKRMQADLQKELRCAFNEIHQLNGLLAGKVPKDLLSRVELEKKIADYTKQLASALEEKHVLEQEVSRLSEYKSLPSEVEHLKDQVQKTSEELHLLKNEKAQSASLIDGQKHRLQEQIERIEKLTEEVTHVQAKFQQAEQQYSELKLLYEDLQERHSVTAEGLKNQKSEAECLLKQMDELKRSVESMEQKLSATLQESEELVQAKQELAAHIKEMEEVHRSTLLERDNLQDQVNNLSSIVTALLQQQADKQSELYNEKLALEEKLIPEMEQLREQIGDLQSSLNTMQIENAEASRKLEELHDELKLAVHHRDELHVKVEDLKAEKDSLKQDLNENIELSIETQEELKRQKQLVADLKKQIADSAGGDSLQAESQENILEEQISMLIKKLQENEAKYETISNEKMELERVHQSLISEMEVLQERMQSAELALAKVDELKNISKNIQEETDCLKDEMDGSAGQMNEQVQQYSRRHLLEDGDVKHLQQQILIVLQECEHLHETLKNMMHERDQMKLDLQENIERSIETQEELRSALDELNNKTHLLDTLQVNGKDLEQKILQLEEQLNAMMAERDQVIAELRTVTEQQQNLEESNRVTKDGSPLKEGGERYLDQPEEEESSRTELKCGMEKIKKVELENQLNTIYGNLRETESKYEKAVESLELITKEKDHLISSLTVANNGLVNELALYRQGKETKDQELQASDEMHTNRDQAATASRLEETETERNLLKEKLYQLQQQLDFISHEREGHQQLIDNLKAERSQLSDLQRYTESEVIRCREEGAEIEKLKEQLRNTQQQLEYKDKEILGTMKSSEQVNGIDEGQEHGGAQAVFCNQYPGDIAFKQLEENLQKNSSLLEIMQGEKQELSNKLHLLHEELEKGILHRDDLQCKLESVLSENALLKENMETVLSCSSRTREELQRCQEELQQQTNLVNDLGLQAPGNSAKQEKETTTDFMPSLEDKVLGLQEELLQKTTEHQQLLEKKEELEEDKKSLTCEVESLVTNMVETQANLESLQNNKLETESQLLDLQQQMEIVVQERDDLNSRKVRLIAEMDQLKDTLKENNELVIYLKNELQQKTDVCQHEELEQIQLSFKNELEEHMKNLKNTEAGLETLRSEKLDTEQRLFHLQSQMELVTQEWDDLKTTQQCLITERDKLKEDLEKSVEMVLGLQGELLQKAAGQQELLQKKAALEKGQNSLQCEVESLMKNMMEGQTTLESLQNEKLETEQKLIDLQQHMEVVAQERNDLKTAHERLTEMNHLKECDEMQKTTEEEQRLLENEVLTQTQTTRELDLLMKHLKDMETDLACLQNEKINSNEKIFNLQQHMETVTQERNELKAMLQSLLSERDQLKEDLKENVEKLLQSIETQDDLRRAQEECQQQRQRVEKMTSVISSLEQKSFMLEGELHETTTLVKEAVGAREILEQSKQQLASEMEQLMEALKSKESALGEVEREKSEASKKILELTAELRTMAEERDQMQHSKVNLLKESTETQEELGRTQEELQQQKQRIEKLTNEIYVLEEKSSTQERELHETTTLLKEAVGAREILEQSKQQLASEMEQLMEALKSKESALGEVERENSEASKKILELTAELRTMAEERDQMQHSKSTDTQEQLRRNQDELQQQTQRIGKLTNEVSVLEEKSSTLERELQENMTLLKEAVGAREILDQSKQQLASEMEQLMEALKSKELELGQGEMEKEEAFQRVLELTNGMRSISEERDQLQLSKENLQEEEQFQQLLQRARSETENIYKSLQDQEKDTAQLRDAWITCQTELQAIKKERDDSNEDLLEKVNEINEMLQQISSLQQLHQEVNDEKMKNCDLCEKVDLMEKEIRVLRLMQNEPVQEEDELAERTEILERKNQELKDLMVNISTVYSNHHSLLNNLSSELHSETEMQKQSMCAIKESLSSTLSRAFGNLQTEHNKLNTQLQTLLNKFKVICRNAAVKEEHYSSVNDYDSDLRAVQKKNDALLLQCQNLEEHGTKWSESASDDLKFVELEFLNQMIFKKMQVIKRVGDGFSEVQGVLNSMEGDLKEEAKCKKPFLLWLEEFKGLHFDAKKLSEGVVQENKRVTGVLQLLTKKLKSVAQSRTKQDTMMYLNQLETDLQEKKEKNKELLQRIQHLAPSGDSSFMEEENARLREKLKNVQGELKKMQCRIQDLENELSSAKADAKQKEEKASRLEEKLLSSTAESEISEMQSKMTEKEKHLLTAQKEIQILKEKISQGAAPYKDEIDNLKSQMVKVEMDRMKLSKSADQQIASLKCCIEDKEEYLRKLKENLRRSQKDTDTTFCGAKDGASLSQYPLTCGGGSGIVQSTAMLMLQSENAALKREISQYKKRCHHLSRNISIREDELKKVMDNLSETPSMLLGSLQQSEVMSQSKAEVYRQTAVSPSKSEVPPPHIASPGKTGIRRKRLLSPCKTELHKPQPMSPNKMERHSVPAMSPGKIGLLRKPDVSPFKTDGPLFSTLTESPCKKKNLLEKLDSPKEKFFDARSKSMPYCPTKFFDNSTLGDLPDRSAPSSDINPDLEAERDLYAATTTETSEVNNWWDRADKNENANECKTS